MSSSISSLLSSSSLSSLLSATSLSFPLPLLSPQASFVVVLVRPRPTPKPLTRRLPGHAVTITERGFRRPPAQEAELRRRHRQSLPRPQRTENMIPSSANQSQKPQSQKTRVIQYHASETALDHSSIEPFRESSSSTWKHTSTFGPLPSHRLFGFPFFCSTNIHGIVI